MSRLLFIGSLLLTLAPFSAMASTLTDSLDRELSLLRQESQTLSELKTETQKSLVESKEKNRKQLENLTTVLLKLRDANQQLAQEVGLPSLRTPVTQQKQLLDRTLARLNKSLQALPTKVAPITTEFERTPGAMQQLVNQIYQEGRMRVERGSSYFGDDGAARTSDILWISQVGAIALEAVGGPLLPTEANHIQLAPQLDTERRSQAVTDGNNLIQSTQPVVLHTLIFDPKFPSTNQFQADKSLLETIEDGGFVMWPIILLAFLAIVICVERLWNLNEVHTNAEKLMNQVDQFIQHGQWADADQCCTNNPGVVAKVMGVILKHRKLTRVQMEDRANEVILTSRPELERFISGLNIIAVVSPLLGLLGTVTGMIATFLVITQHGTGDPKLMAGGISEALLTTQYGLMVAIPALMAHSLLNRWVEHILGDIETNSLQLLNSIEHLSFESPVKSNVHQLPSVAIEGSDA